MKSVATATTSAAERKSFSEANGAGASHRASWLLCRAGACLFAVGLEHVIEIMRVLPIELVAGAPRYVRGLCIIRGAPAPVIDPGILVSDQAIEPTRLIAIRTGARVAALAADSVLGVRISEAETLNQLPPLLRDAATETVAAIGTLDAELLFFLHAARIVPEGFFDRLDSEGT